MADVCSCGCVRERHRTSVRQERKRERELRGHSVRIREMKRGARRRSRRQLRNSVSFRELWGHRGGALSLMLGGWACSKRNPPLALNAPLCDNSARWVLKRKVAPCKTQCSCPLSWTEVGGFSHLKSWACML